MILYPIPSHYEYQLEISIITNDSVLLDDHTVKYLLVFDQYKQLSDPKEYKEVDWDQHQRLSSIIVLLLSYSNPIQ